MNKCEWEGPSCTPSLAVASTGRGAGQQQSQAPWGLPLPASACGLSHWKSLWQYPSGMRWVLSESPGEGEWGSPDWYRFKLSTSAGSDTTQQMSQNIPSLADTRWLLAHLSGGLRSQRFFRARPAELIRPKWAKIWPYEGRALHQAGVQWKNVPCPRSTQLSLWRQLKKNYFFTFLREGEGGRKRRRETAMCERYVDWLPLAHPQLGPGLHPRRVPWLGVGLATSQFPRQCSIPWATPVRTTKASLKWK